MHINFYDDPLNAPQSPEDVRFIRLGFFVYPEGRRVAVGFQLTPFRERPSIEVDIRNRRGEQAGSLTVIEALQPNFSLTMHLRDLEPTEVYDVEAVLYYTGEPGDPRQIVHQVACTFDASEPGEQICEVGKEEG